MGFFAGNQDGHARDTDNFSRGKSEAEYSQFNKDHVWDSEGKKWIFVGNIPNVPYKGKLRKIISQNSRLQGKLPVGKHSLRFEGKVLPDRERFLKGVVAGLRGEFPSTKFEIIAVKFEYGPPDEHGYVDSVEVFFNVNHNALPLVPVIIAGIIAGLVWTGQAKPVMKEVGNVILRTLKAGGKLVDAVGNTVPLLPEAVKAGGRTIVNITYIVVLGALFILYKNPQILGIKS